ncbi:retrovirus-related pol polyprotein from transposon TNT 1-94 [Tanacetum coccineum]
MDGDVNLSSKEDKVLWVTNAGKKVVFTTKQAWEDLRVNWPSVNWSHIIWFNQLIPRQAFILWMAVQNRLLTQDKVEKWNHNGDIKCGFCKQCRDSSPHLFFQCDFSMKIWRKMIKLSYLMDMQFNLQDVIESMAGRRGMKSIGNMVLTRPNLRPLGNEVLETDLGTTKSCLAVMERNVVTLLLDAVKERRS